MISEDPHFVRFRVYGTPKGQPRPKAFVRRGAVHGPRAAVYDPATADGWKEAVRNAALDAIACPTSSPHAPFYAGKPIVLSVEYIFPRPKNHFRTGKLEGQVKDSAPHWHTSKPDRNNVEKALEDALGEWPRGESPVFWDDDRCVVDGRSVKRYAKEGERAGAVVTVEAL